VSRGSRWYRWTVRAYGAWVLHRGDGPRRIGPALTIEVRRARQAIRLSDGTEVGPGQPLGIVHLNNRRMVELHAESRGAHATGVAFRRDVLASARALAEAAADGGALAHVRVFRATSVFPDSMWERFGLERVADAPFPGSRIVGAMQRAILAALHPGREGRTRSASLQSRRMWFSRDQLIARYGGPARPPASGGRPPGGDALDVSAPLARRRGEAAGAGHQQGEAGAPANCRSTRRR
jgi:hypothetical protein